MRYIIKNGAISINGEYLLDSINLSITDNKHIGIVGRNGSGKSTLLKSLINNDLLESGLDDSEFQIIKEGNPSIIYLEQIILNDNKTLYEEVSSVFSELINIEKRMNNIVLDNDNAILEYSNLVDRYRLLGGYEYKKEIEIFISKFGFNDKDKLKLLRDFSGGERIKISLIKMLLSKPDILLLDEPTNHLDMDTTIWLESYLKSYKKCLILVSHDREFLNNVVDMIYEISYKKVILYNGNYDYYEKERVIRYEKSLKEYDKYNEEVERLNNLYLKFRNKPTKAKMALERLKRIEKMEVVEKPEKLNISTMKVNINEFLPSSNDVLELINLAVGYDKDLYKISLRVNKGEKLGIIGKNGTGKSTLIKTLVDEIPFLSGKIKWGKNINIGYFSQDLIMNDSSNTILEEFMLNSDMSIEEARNTLGSFKFRSDDVYKKINNLSGGERVRLQLAKIFKEKPNVLILDEVTNHLDIATKEYLEGTLSEYKGTIIFVSHDRYFIRKLATSLVVLDGDPVKYNYGYDDYIKSKSIVLNDIERVSNSKNKIVKSSSNNKIKNLERNITKLEGKIKELKNSLYKEEVYSNIEESNKISKEIDRLSKELDSLNEEWMELMEGK